MSELRTASQEELPEIIAQRLAERQRCWAHLLRDLYELKEQQADLSNSEQLTEITLSSCPR